MKALILAAGKGTRVMPLTRSCPKPMLRILDTPVLELLINGLRAHGIDQIMINTGHHAAAIEDYFGDGHRFGVKIAYSFEGRLEDGELIGDPIGSAASIRNIHSHAGFFDDTFMVLCGDAVLDIDYTALWAYHKSKGGIATIALQEVPRDQVESYGVVVRDGTDRVTSFQEKPKVAEALGNHVNTGIYLFEPTVLEHIPDTIPYDLGGQVFPDLVKKGLPVYGATLPMTWLDIGRLPDYHRVCMMAISGEVPGLASNTQPIAEGVHAGINVRINLDRVSIQGPVIIAGGAWIGDDVTLIGPCYIGAGSVIESGASIERSVIMKHARIGKNAHVADMTTDGRYCLLQDGTVIDLVQTDIPWLMGDARVPENKVRESEQNFLKKIS